MTLTTIINETPALVEFHNQFGEIIIDRMVDTLTGDAIAPDFLGEMDALKLYGGLYEAWANRNEHCDFEQEYKNV